MSLPCPLPKARMPSPYAPLLATLPGACAWPVLTCVSSRQPEWQPTGTDPMGGDRLGREPLNLTGACHDNTFGDTRRDAATSVHQVPLRRGCRAVPPSE